MFPVLQERLHDEDALVRFAAITAVRRFGEGAAPLLPALRECARDSNPAVRAQAEEALRSLPIGDSADSA